MKLAHGLLLIILFASGVQVGHWSRDGEMQRAKDALTGAQVVQCTKANPLNRPLPKDS